MPDKVEPRTDDDVVFRRRDLKGSRLRCLVATSLPNSDVAAFLNNLVRPHAYVCTEDIWQPRGLLEGGEARLGETLSFLKDEQREAVTSWWLAVRERANTPNWDIVSTCQAEGRRGLVLVEAKAHSGELHRSGKPDGNAENGRRISAAIEDANRALGGAQAGWGLCTGTTYQLCNRFAWAWKIASLGVHVVLVYLGFLDAEEMRTGVLATAEDWRSSVVKHAKGVVPEDVWGRRIEVGESWFVPIIRAARVSTTVVEN